MSANEDDLDSGSTLRGFVEGQQVFGRYALRRILGRAAGRIARCGLLLAVAAGCLFMREGFAKDRATWEVAMGEGSVKLDGVEVLEESRVGEERFFSREVLEGVLGLAEERFRARGLWVEVWPSRGVTVQTGWRGLEKDRLFKMQIAIEERRDKESGKSSGRFGGVLLLEGLRLDANTTFESARLHLEKHDYRFQTETEVTSGKKSGPWGSVAIFGSKSSGKITRVDYWCL